MLIDFIKTIFNRAVDIEYTDQLTVLDDWQ